MVGKLNIVQSGDKTYNNVEVLDFAFGPKSAQPTGYTPAPEPKALGDEIPW